MVKELRGMIYSKYRSEAEFARQISWSRQKLNKITNGERIPDVIEVAQIANGLNENIETIANIFLSA